MLLVCICTGLSKAINPRFVAFEAVSFWRIQRTRIVIFKHRFAAKGAFHVESSLLDDVALDSRQLR